MTNIDSSSVVINQMADLHSDLEDMEYTVMDACAMEFIPDHCFDLIVDKALFDCLLCSSSNMHRVTKYVKEMYRVLKPGGSFVVVSHGAPDTRKAFLSSIPSGDDGADGAPLWVVNHQSLLKPDINKESAQYQTEMESTAKNNHYAYICVKPKE